MSSQAYKLVNPMPAASFLATLGVDTHIAYTDGGYANLSNVISEMKYLGIDQVRDGISNGVDGAAPLSSYITLAKAGIHFTFIVDHVSSNSGLLVQLSLMDQVERAVPGSITAIEGPNEINNQPVDYNGETGLAGALAEQKNLYSDVHSDSNLLGVPVDYFTGYGAGGIAEGPDPSTTSGLANYDNQHPYPNFGEAPAFWVSRSQALGNTSNANAPAVYTETGYTTNQVNAAVQAVYTLDLLMDTAKEGISKTYLYQLMDAYAPGSPQGDAGYGLYDYQNDAKPVATAIHDLTSLLSDPGQGFQTTALSYSISGMPSDGNSMVLEKSNGTYVVVLWAEPQIWNNNTGSEIAAPSEQVTLSLPNDYSLIKVFDPLQGTSAIAISTDQNSVTVSLTDHPILIKLRNPVAAANASAVVPADGDTALQTGPGSDRTIGTADAGLTVWLRGAPDLALSKMHFITGVGGRGDDTGTATTMKQTLTNGYGADMLNRFYVDSFPDTAAGLAKDMVNVFGGDGMMDMSNRAIIGSSVGYRGSGAVGNSLTVNHVTDANLTLITSSDAAKS